MRGSYTNECGLLQLVEVPAKKKGDGTTDEINRGLVQRRKGTNVR